MKNVCVLGSTGSIGRAALEIIHHLESEFNLFAISCNANTSLLRQQIELFHPKYACITNPDKARDFSSLPPKRDFRFTTTSSTTILTGIDGLKELASHPAVDIVLNALVGTIGVLPTLSAIKSKKRIAMANKETLVGYGSLIMQEVEKNNITFIPVDSEHSAIHQCINQAHSSVRRIILTASGGPFLSTPIPSDITKNLDALKHPVWKMGEKISIDSATLMNKGLEVIEAAVLFNIPPQDIKVIIHPQSIIHSAVEFVDGTIIACLSLPDMKLPIQYSLTFPNRLPSLIQPLELDKIGRLDFTAPDLERFPCLRLAYEAAYTGGTMPCVLNAANQVAVTAFLDKKINLMDIPVIIETVMQSHQKTEDRRQETEDPTILLIESAEQWAEVEANKEVQKLCG